MSNISAARDRNRNFISMDAVIVQGVFTPSAPLIWKHFLSSVGTSTSATAKFPNFSGANDEAVRKESDLASHDRMVAAAKKLQPPQAWFEEDFSKLRKPSA